LEKMLLLKGTIEVPIDRNMHWFSLQGCWDDPFIVLLSWDVFEDISFFQSRIFGTIALVI
ncbi:hypothetical protein ACJX0J_030518, partial [Zea mays]